MIIITFHSIDWILILLIIFRCSAVTCLSQSCSVVTPFPHIFNSGITVDGRLSWSPRPAKTGVSDVAQMTSLQSTSDAGNYIQALLQEVRKYNIRKFHRFTDAGLEVDEFQEVLESLKMFLKNYKNSDSEGSEDSDLE